MFHKAVNLEFKEGTKLQLTFQNGEIKEYDMSSLFPKFPELEALKDRNLFLRGKLMGPYGIFWNDDLDIEAETIYEDGITIGKAEIPINQSSSARAKAEIAQSEPLSEQKSTR